MNDEQRHTLSAEQMPAGARVRAWSSDEGSVWTAGDPRDASRWMHESGHRQVSDAVMQRWLSAGKAEALP